MKKILVKMIRFYQKQISYVFNKNGTNCKFYPTCSNYSIEAIKKYGAVHGGLKAFKRILRCNPFSKGGYDPLN